MATIDIKVVRWPMFFSPGSWKAQARVEGGRLIITGKSKSLDIRLEDLKKASFNSMSGMWMLKPKTGKKFYFHTAGPIFKTTLDDQGHTDFVLAMGDALKDKL